MCNDMTLLTARLTTIGDISKGLCPSLCQLLPTAVSVPLSIQLVRPFSRLGLSHSHGWAFSIRTLPCALLHGCFRYTESGPGTAVFETDLANYSVCEGMEDAPNRFSMKDCRIACAYDPNCLVWQAFPIEHGRKCYQGYTGASRMTRVPTVSLVPTTPSFNFNVPSNNCNFHAIVSASPTPPAKWETSGPLQPVWHTAHSTHSTNLHGWSLLKPKQASKQTDYLSSCMHHARLEFSLAMRAV
jgi:hypothetical protein